MTQMPDCTDGAGTGAASKRGDSAPFVAYIQARRAGHSPRIALGIARTDRDQAVRVHSEDGRNVTAHLRMAWISDVSCPFLPVIYALPARKGQERFLAGISRTTSRHPGQASQVKREVFETLEEAQYACEDLVGDAFEEADLQRRLLRVAIDAMEKNPEDSRWKILAREIGFGSNGTMNEITARHQRFRDMVLDGDVLLREGPVSGHERITTLQQNRLMIGNLAGHA